MPNHHNASVAQSNNYETVNLVTRKLAFIKRYCANWQHDTKMAVLARHESNR